MTRQQLTNCVSALALCMLFSCGGAQNHLQRSPASAPSTVDASPLVADDPHAQIQALADRIGLRHTQLQLPAPIEVSAGADPDPVNPMATSTAVSPMPQTCRQSLKPLCTDSCTLGASICDDAGKLCELTKQLQPDAWAESKCNGAKHSCAAAIKRCCDCR